MTLQKHVAALVSRDDEAAQILLHLAAAARRSGRLPIAMIALHELQTTFRCTDTVYTCCVVPCIMQYMPAKSSATFNIMLQAVSFILCFDHVIIDPNGR